jgi:hypothetical protein
MSFTNTRRLIENAYAFDQDAVAVQNWFAHYITKESDLVPSQLTSDQLETAKGVAAEFNADSQGWYEEWNRVQSYLYG